MVNVEIATSLTLFEIGDDEGNVRFSLNPVHIVQGAHSQPIFILPLHHFIRRKHDE